MSTLTFARPGDARVPDIAPAAVMDAELSDDDLEAVVGGLARTFPMPITVSPVQAAA